MNKHKFRYFAKVVSGFLMAFSAFSCREEVIPQNDLVGQRNFPVTTNYADIYELAVDAENFFHTIKDSLTFYTPIDFLELAVHDYTSGTVYVKVSAINGKVVFEDLLSKNITYSNDNIENMVPRLVELYFSNYSGKFKLKLIPRL